MKHYLGFFLTIVVLGIGVFSANAQYNIDIQPERSKQRILIIPFDPSIYSNDASHIWSKQNNLTSDEIREKFRKELNRRIQFALTDSCESIDLLTAYNKEARNELLGLYTTVSYEMRRAMKNKKEENKHSDSFLKRLFKKKEKYTDTVTKGHINNGEIISRKYSLEDKYLHIIYNNPNFIKELCERRNYDQVIFINQLEIKGKYGDPYITGNPKAIRNLKVHYSIYNNKGELLFGGFSDTNIPFNLVNINDIIEDHFPTIVRKITLNIDYK